MLVEQSHGDGRFPLLRGGRNVGTVLCWAVLSETKSTSAEQPAADTRAMPSSKMLLDCRRAVRRLFNSRTAWGRLVRGCVAGSLWRGRAES